METHVTFSGTEQHVAHEVEGGSMAVAVGGAGAVVLAIVGLIGLIPAALAAIATIALGAVLMLSSGALATRYSRALTGAMPSANAQQEIVGGLGLEGMAGLAAVVLGILALLGADPAVLLNAAAIVLGGGLIMASGALARLELLTHSSDAPAGGAPQQIVHAASGADVLVGGTAIVLGIVGLGGHDPVTLALVAMLCIGAAVMITGSTIATRMFSLFA